MKKWGALLLAMVMCLGLAACGGGSGEKPTGKVNQPSAISEPSDEDIIVPNVEEEKSIADIASEVPSPETSSENKMDTPDKVNTVSEPEPPKYEYAEINFGELQSLEFVEITIDGAASSDEIKPDKPDRVYRYMSDREGEKYVYIYGTIKNISGNKYEFADNMYAEMTFDEKYNYRANITADEGGNFSYIYAYLDPLKSEKIYITASIPDELAETYNQVVVKFGFAENFDGAYNIEESECDYLYSITITK